MSDKGPDEGNLPVRRGADELARTEHPGDEIDGTITPDGEVHRFLVLDGDDRVLYEQSYVAVRGTGNWSMVDPDDESSESPVLRVDVLQGSGKLSDLGTQGEEMHEHTLEVGGNVELPKGSRFRYEAGDEDLLLREVGPGVVSLMERGTMDAIDVGDQPRPPDVV